MKNSLRVTVRHDTTKIGCCIVADSGTQNDGLRILVIEELEHLPKREGAAYIGIQDKESFRFALQDGISEVIETTSRAECLVLPQVLDFELWEFLAGIFDEVFEHALIIIANEDDFFDAIDLGNGLEIVPNDGMARNIKQGLPRVSISSLPESIILPLVCPKRVAENVCPCLGHQPE